MRLWKDTFHDTDRYIRIVFDAYFNPENICVRYDGHSLVAALLGVPYRFVIPHAEGVRYLSGLYLCGLATRPEYRKQGIMSRMMEEIQARAVDRGLDMTFLIPADAHLREYYRQRGYFDFSRREDAAFERTDVMGECCPHLVRTLFEKGDMSCIRQLAEWCVAREVESKLPLMIHSVDDMVAVMAENENAIFFTDCRSGQEYRNLANLVAVAFPEDSYEVLTKNILRRDPTVPFSWNFRKIFVKSKGESFLSSSDIASVDAGPYAMARLLPACKIPEVAFPQFSVSLLLD